MSGRKFYSASDLVVRWGVSPAHVYRMIERGEVRAARFGAVIRVPVEEVERVERAQLGYVAGASAK